MRTLDCPGCGEVFAPTADSPATPLKTVQGRGRYSFSKVELFCAGCMSRLWTNGTWKFPNRVQVLGWPDRDAKANTSLCEGCGVVVSLVEDSRRKVAYCSESCRHVAYRRRDAKANTSLCGHCGEAFTARRGAKYCSPKCRQAAYRSRSALP